MDERIRLALCRLCHWTFDEGLMAVTGRYRLLISPQLRHEPNRPGHLTTLAERELLGPAEAPLWPVKATLAWHRERVFRRR